jgi:ribose transport system substrate-binding protein
MHLLKKITLACLLAGTGHAIAAQNVTLGVAIPTATHGFTGGIVWWANQAKKELEAANPNLKVIVKTAGSTPEQANQVQDLLVVNRMNALVILPLESASLTQPVAQVKNKGVYVTVVDRGLTSPAAQNAYVAGDNTAFGRLPAEYLAK